MNPDCKSYETCELKKLEACNPNCPYYRDPKKLKALAILQTWSKGTLIMALLDGMNPKELEQFIKQNS